jgi:hypothetical protein
MRTLAVLVLIAAAAHPALVAETINSPRSRIRTEIGANLMTLESSDNEAMGQAFERCQKDLKLKDNIDPFATFAELDEGVDVDEENEPIA